MDIAEDVKEEAARWMLELQADLSHRVSTGDVAEEPLVQTYIAKAIQAERERCEWQDISTTAKEGRILLFCARVDGMIHTGQWRENIRSVDGEVVWDGSGWVMDGFDHPFTIPPFSPTHWRPLPAPPKDKP